MHNQYFRRPMASTGLNFMRTFSIVTLFLLPFAVGCDGGSGISLKGTVTVDGVSVPKASMSFEPIGGTSSPSMSSSVKDGEFSIAARDGMKAGTFKVTLRLPPGERPNPLSSEPVADPANLDLGAAIEAAKANAPKSGKVYRMEVQIQGASDDVQLEFTSE